MLWHSIIGGIDNLCAQTVSALFESGAYFTPGPTSVRARKAVHILEDEYPWIYDIEDIAIGFEQLSTVVLRTDDAAGPPSGSRKRLAGRTSNDAFNACVSIDLRVELPDIDLVDDSGSAKTRMIAYIRP
jgi:hypothetical protein